MLGVAKDATEVQLREAYHRKVQETHPDKLSNLGLSPDLVKFAHERMARSAWPAAKPPPPRAPPPATATRHSSRRAKTGAP